MTIHSRAEQLFAEAIDFDLTPAEHAEVTEHLASCATCRTLASGYRTDAAALREIAFAQPPAWVQAAVLAAAERPIARTIRRWKVLVAAALLAGLTIAGVVIGSLLLRHASPLAGGPLVVYELRGTFADVYTLDVTSGIRTPHGSVQLHAPIGAQRIRWAADGRSAFVFGDGEHVEARVDLATGGIVVLDLLTLDGQQDEVSPAGDRVARLLGDAERGMRLSVVDLSGAELVNLALPTGVIAYSGIAWAPDGSSLLVSGCMPCDLKGSPSPANVNHLFLVPLDGSPIQMLADDSTGFFSSARFSPDGSTIAYSSVLCRNACTGGISTMRIADGSGNTLTTSGPDGAPAWSPDGERIAFQRGGSDGGIYVMDLDGSHLIRLTTPSPDLVDRDRVPVWSPDGGWIAFTRDVSDTSLGDLWIVPSDGGEARLLAQNAVADWGPTTKMMALVSPAPATTSPSAPPSVGPRVSASTSPGPAASGPIPLDAGLLLVHQIDGTSPADAHTQSVYLVDIGTGERTPLGTLALTEATCCPEEVQWSSDRRRAFLSSELGVNGIVDLDASSVQAGAAAPPGQYKAAISRAGDRIARVDQVSGKSETIVISDLAGLELSRLRVPKDRHVQELIWSPDDGSLAVTGQRYPGGDPELAVTYLFIVPLDGTPERDLADNAAEVAGAGSPGPRIPFFRVSRSGVVARWENDRPRGPVMRVGSWHSHRQWRRDRLAVCVHGQAADFRRDERRADRDAEWRGCPWAPELVPRRHATRFRPVRR